MQRKKIEIEVLLKSSKYLPILFIIIMLLMIIAGTITVNAGGTENPNDSSPI